MIRISFCLRRREGMSREEFQRYWREEHAPLVARHAEILRIRRYVQMHTIDDPRLLPIAAARGCEDEPYDGIAEIWFDSADDMLASGGSADARAAGMALLEDEGKFIDLARSPLFFSKANEVIA